MADEIISIESITVIEVSARRVPHGLFEHYCEHPGCNEWGAFGFDKARRTRWYCFEHRDDGELYLNPPNPRGSGLR